MEKERDSWWYKDKKKRDKWCSVVVDVFIMGKEREEGC